MRMERLGEMRPEEIMGSGKTPWRKSHSSGNSFVIPNNSRAGSATLRLACLACFLRIPLTARFCDPVADVSAGLQTSQCSWHPTQKFLLSVAPETLVSHRGH